MKIITMCIRFGNESKRENETIVPKIIYGIFMVLTYPLAILFLIMLAIYFHNTAVLTRSLVLSAFGVIFANGFYYGIKGSQDCYCCRLAENIHNFFDVLWFIAVIILTIEKTSPLDYFLKSLLAYKFIIYIIVLFHYARFYYRQSRNNNVNNLSLQIDVTENKGADTPYV